AIVGMTFARSIQRDLVWYYTPLIQIAALCFGASFVTFQSAKGRLGTIGRGSILIGLLSMAAVEIHIGKTVPLQVDLNYNLYGWDPRRFGFPIYAGNQLAFQVARQTRIPDWTLSAGSGGVAALSQSIHLNDTWQTVGFVLPNQEISIIRIGVLARGHTV